MAPVEKIIEHLSHGRHCHARMCAMIAITVKMMKLVMKMEWNSFASCSVRPDKEPLLLSAAMLVLSVR